MIDESFYPHELFAAARARYLQGNFQRAKADFETVLAQARMIDHKAGQARVLLALGKLAEIADNGLEKARTLKEAALAIYSDLGLTRERAYTLTALSRVYLSGGDAQRALRCLDEAMDIFRQRQDNLGLASALHELFCIRLLEKDLMSAEQHLREGLRLCEELESKPDIARMLVSLGAICLAFHRDFPMARAHFHRALDLFEEIGHTFEARIARHNLGAADNPEPNLAIGIL